MNKFFKNYPPFEGLDEHIISKIVGSSKVKQCASNTLLIEQGAAATNFIFIKSGLFKLMRKIGFHLNPLTKTISINDFREPKAWDYVRGNAYQVLLELDEIGQNSVLCDYEIFNKKKMFYSAVSFMPSQAIMISHLDLK